MPTQLGITNLALVLLGSDRIVTINDDVKAAREALAIFDQTRDALLGAFNWSFAKTRVQLAATGVAPVFGYANAFNLPADCLRVLNVNDTYAGLDLTDYVGVPNPEFTIEGRQILAVYSSPINLRYVKQVTDPTVFYTHFANALSAQLAFNLCETLTQSSTKKADALAARNRELSLAIRANAIELPPETQADSSWVMSRL